MGDVFSGPVDLSAVKSPVYLDPEIAGEGYKGTLSNGDPDLEWRPAEVEANLPRYDKIKALAHLFAKKPFRAFPAMLYHPTEDPVVISSNEESLKHGVIFRETNAEEKAKFQGQRFTWDYLGGTEWRAVPFARDLKPSIHNSSGKNVVHFDRTAELQNELIERVVIGATEAIAKALKIAQPGAPGVAPTAVGSAPQQIDGALWQRFQAFVAWEESNKAALGPATMDVLDANAHLLSDGEPEETEAAEAAPATSALAGSTRVTAAEELAMWRAEAERVGVKPDKRWGVERLKEEVDKAQAAA
ncbi:MAG: hypothetical protein P4L76_17750 [Beijerinckiaceae bacterium]|nr:hypothetical protein [Beijerinckiaceae bacterium]